MSTFPKQFTDELRGLSLRLDKKALNRIGKTLEPQVIADGMVCVDAFRKRNHRNLIYDQVREARTLAKSKGATKFEATRMRAKTLTLGDVWVITVRAQK